MPDAPGRSPLVVKITCGVEAPARLSQGFTVAATAATAGASVSVWLTGEAVWMAVAGRAAEFSLPHAAPLDSLLAIILESGRVTVCTQCAARRELTQSDLLPGIVISGATSYVDEVLTDEAQALVY